MDACKQRLYDSQAIAAQKAHEANLSDEKSKGKHRPYYCLRCGGWHIALIIRVEGIQVEGDENREPTEPRIAALGLPNP